MSGRLLTFQMAAAILLFQGCEADGYAARFHEELRETHAMASGGRLSVENFNGSVEIFGWDREEAEIHATKHASSQDLLDAIRIEITPAAGGLSIRTVRPSERRGSMGAKFVIHVPRRTELERIISSNGAIALEGLKGNARLRTSNGGIRVTGLEGELDATTSNGGVKLRQFQGGAVVATSNGGIDAEEVEGYFDAKTSNGGIEARIMRAQTGRPVRAETSNGNIRLTLESSPAGDIHAATNNASITLRLPSSTSAELRARTSNSNIKTDFDILLRGGVQSKSRLEGKIGAGGPLIELTTSNGGIHLQKM